MGEILNGKYRRLQNDPIGEGGQAKVYLYEALSDKKKYFNRNVSLLYFFFPFEFSLKSGN